MTGCERRDSAAVLSEGDVVGMFKELSNWGRWGDNDERGTLNLITPSKRVEAAREIRVGGAISIARNLDTAGAAGRRPAVRHQMHYYGPDPISSGDSVSLDVHGMASTHVDALGHEFFRGTAYNGRSRDEIVTHGGLAFGDILAQAEGVFTRAVLLDVAQMLKVSWLEPDHCITADELNMTMEVFGLEIKAGDAVLVHSGFDRWQSHGAPNVVAEARAGLGPDCLRWLRERDVSVYAGDCIEQLPSPYSSVPFPLHQIGIAAIGLVLLDSVRLDGLVEVAKTIDRYTYALAYAPLRLGGGTGSPVNPVCLF